MDDNKFWLRVIQTVAVLIMIFIVSIASYNINSNYILLKIVEDGADPIAARCAVTGGICNDLLLSRVTKE